MQKLRFIFKKPLAKPLGLLAVFILGLLLNQLLHQLTAKPINYCYLSNYDCEQSGVKMQLANEVTHSLVPNRLIVQWQNSQPEQIHLVLRDAKERLSDVKVSLHYVGHSTYHANLLLPFSIEKSMVWLGEMTDGELTVYPAIKVKQ